MTFDPSILPSFQLIYLYTPSTQSFDSPQTQSSSPIHPYHPHPTSIRLDTGVVSEGEGNYTDGDSPLLERRSASLEDVNSSMQKIPNVRIPSSIVLHDHVLCMLL